MFKHRETIAKGLAVSIGELSRNATGPGIQLPKELIGATEPGVPATEPSVAARMTGKLTPAKDGAK